MKGSRARIAADSTDGSRAGTGAVTGALAGLGLGALAGLGVLSGVIPVIGPAIAAGTLGIILTNAAAGAGIGGLVGALAGAGIPEDEAHYYQGEFESGRTIVTVQAEGRADEAMAILRRYDAYDMSSRPGVRRLRDALHGRDPGCSRAQRGRDRRLARRGPGHSLPRARPEVVLIGRGPRQGTGIAPRSPRCSNIGTGVPLTPPVLIALPLLFTFADVLAHDVE